MYVKLTEVQDSLKIANLKDWYKKCYYTGFHVIILELTLRNNDKGLFRKVIPNSMSAFSFFLLGPIDLMATSQTTMNLYLWVASAYTSVP